MHGRKRSEYKALQRDPKVVAALTKKATRWHLVSKELADNRNEDRMSSEKQLQLLDKLLSVNPDPLHLWNHRREIVQSDFDLQTELTVTATALQNNPKAYGAWTHRKWTLVEAQKRCEQQFVDELHAAELSLTEQFLQRDERNFHCWNYRRFVVGVMLGSQDGSWENVLDGCMGPQLSTSTSLSLRTVSQAQIKGTLEGEWSFCESKIQANFSNFSALSLRSQLLSWKLSQEATNAAEFIANEFQMIESAIFTEPHDQSAWWYHHFILRLDSYEQGPWLRELLQSHLDDLQQLAEEEAKCKWVFIGIWHVLEALGNERSDSGREILQTLIAIDPDRACRYQHILTEITA